MTFQKTTNNSLPQSESNDRYSWKWRRNLYKKALSKWEKLQTEMIIEECSELITACANLIKHIQKIKRSETENEAGLKIMYICDEIADIRIMMEQAGIIFDEEITDEIFRKKLDRLEEKLKGDK